MSVPSTSEVMVGVNAKEEVIYAKWERFSNWVHCICIVTFDLELGQAIEVRDSIISSFNYLIRVRNT